MPTLTPLCPIIGLTSVSCLTRRRILSFSAIFVWSARSLLSLNFSSRSCSRLGRNSCRGGSSSLIVTSSPSITLRISLKSFFCIGISCSRNFFRSSTLSARIILCIMLRRSGALNILSVLSRPMPSAPNSLALFAFTASSALALTPRVLISSAHSSSCLSSGESPGSIVGTSPSMTVPMLPSIVMMSPSFTTVLPTVNVLLP